MSRETDIEMPDKTKRQLEEEIRLTQVLEDERKKSDSKYAIKLVEIIVFAAMGIIAIYFLNQLLSLSKILKSDVSQGVPTAKGGVQVTVPPLPVQLETK